jgi:hypothetical protein
MKMILKSAIVLLLALSMGSIISAQDLSKYRKFALGTTLPDLLQQTGQDSREVSVDHQSPALIQEMTVWPVDGSYSSSSANRDPVLQILFSFYNGRLYRMAVTYDRLSMEGLTEDDLVGAISLRYGTGRRYYPEINLITPDPIEPPDEVIARWENPLNSVSLVQSTGINSFRLIVLSKQLDAQAETAITAAVKLETEEAPQKEVDRQNQDAVDVETARQKNLTGFRP